MEGFLPLLFPTSSSGGGKDTFLYYRGKFWAEDGPWPPSPMVMGEAFTYFHMRSTFWMASTQVIACFSTSSR